MRPETPTAPNEEESAPTVRPPPPADPLIGSVIDGRYRIEESIGEGGVGRVYRAMHMSLDRHVAVKVLLAQHADAETAKARFLREAKTLAALHHPNIVSVIDFGVASTPFLVLELVQGRELEELVEKGPLEPKRAIDIMLQLLGALAYAHDSGVIHRDLKPSNLFVRSLPSGVHVEVLDFGLAKFAAEPSAPDQKEGMKVTRAGQVVGTPAYMSPEQVTGDAADPRTDIYSAGAVFFEMLTGALPFESETMASVMRSHVVDDVPLLADVAERAFSEELEAVIQRAMAKTPDDRFAGAREMMAALQATPEYGGLSTQSGVQAIEPEPALESGPESEPKAQATLPSPPRALLIGTGLVLVVLLLVTLLRSGDEDEGALDDGGAETTQPATIADPAPATAGDEKAEDIWENVPPELARYKARLDAGRRLSRRELGSLGAYARNHPEDARPVLLRARGYVAKGWLSHALPYYLEAYEIDANARNDPSMLRSLVRMAESDVLESKGADAVRQIYGSLAQAEVFAAMQVARTPERRARLQRLADSLHE